MLRRLNLRQRPWVPLLLVSLLSSIIFAMLSPQFLTAFNIYVILSNAALLCVIGFSQMVVLSVGEFTLALGGIGALAGIVIGYLVSAQDVSLVVALAVGMFVSGMCGLLNGLLVSRSGVSGFVITLATGGLFTGVALAITRARSYANLPEALTTFGTGRIGFVPYLAGATVTVAMLLAILFIWLRLGRMMLAVGGNAEAAELSGISKSQTIVWAHTLSGILAGVAGVMAMAKLHEANPLLGTEWIIQSFTIAIVGGASLTGGSISVFGVLVAALILATINDGLILLNVNPYWVTLVAGILIFVAVLMGRPETWERLRRSSRAMG